MTARYLIWRGPFLQIGAARKLKKGPAFPPTPLKLWFGPALLGCFGFWQDRNKGAPFESLAEIHVAFGGRKDGVIFADAYTLTREPFCATLARNDIAWNNGLAAELLNTKAATS